jgi:S-adenosylmethionine:tRNA ribosyltransferase-isomerase
VTSGPGSGWVPREAVRLLVIDPRARATASARMADLPTYLAAGDVVVVNDAATLPAALRGTTATGAFVELRLIDTAPLRAVLFGPGDHHVRTEHRPPPPPVGPGDRLQVGGLALRVTAVSPLSPRLVDLSVEGGDADALWTRLYAAGAPIQYAHRDAPLPLWAVQTSYATRPWAAEMPSAGRALTWEILLTMRRRGVEVVALTHAAGLSATGDAALDAALPFPERYEIPAATARTITDARRRGGRVIAIGTTVVRALESAATAHLGAVVAGPGVATLVLTPAHRLRVVGGIVSGIHGPEESHFRLLGAFADAATLASAADRAAALDYQRHELGDACLVLPGALSGRAAVAA